jgi:hypothetical protein
MNIGQIVSFLLGLVIIGEAILLFIGFYLLGEKDNKWKTRFNGNTLLIDILFGMIIIFNSFEKMTLILIAIPALIITHLYREIEYFQKKKQSRFITNGLLFIVNTVKLFFLFVLLFLVLSAGR